MRRRAFIEGSLAILVECGLSTNALHYSVTLPEGTFISREKRKKKGRQNVYEIHIPSIPRASPDPLKAGTKKPPHDQVCLYLTAALGGRRPACQIPGLRPGRHMNSPHIRGRCCAPRTQPKLLFDILVTLWPTRWAKVGEGKGSCFLPLPLGEASERWRAFIRASLKLTRDWLKIISLIAIAVGVGEIAKFHCAGVK